MIQSDNQLLLLGGDTPSTWIIYNEMVQRFGVFPALIEKPVARHKLLANRVKKLGLLAVANQMAFVVFLRPLIRLHSRRRVAVLRRINGLEAAMPNSDYLHRVDSVNNQKAQALIAKFNPKVVIVNGTRILSRKTLAQMSGIVINTHQGITPAYRGAHGAYWALYNNDLAHCGVTVHLVDEGIDTGNILAQVMIAPTAEDNFVTYTYLLTAAAIEPLAKAINDAMAGTLQSYPISGQSKLWYHPSFFQYLSGLLRGVR